MWASVVLPPALHLPKGRPSGAFLPSPRRAAVRRRGKEGKREGTLLSIPQRNLVSPTNYQSSYLPHSSPLPTLSSMISKGHSVKLGQGHVSVSNRMGTKAAGHMARQGARGSFSNNAGIGIRNRTNS